MSDTLTFQLPTSFASQYPRWMPASHSCSRPGGACAGGTHGCRGVETGGWGAAGGRLDRDTPRCPATGRPEVTRSECPPFVGKFTGCATGRRGFYERTDVDLDMKGKTGNWRQAAAGGRLNRDPPRRPATGRPEAPASPWHGLEGPKDGVMARKSCDPPSLDSNGTKSGASRKCVVGLAIGHMSLVDTLCT